MLNTHAGVHSPNFSFLARHDDVLMRYGALAERYVFEDANSALIKLRQLAEGLAKRTAAKIGLAFGTPSQAAVCASFMSFRRSPSASERF